MSKCIYKFDGKSVTKNNVPLEISENSEKGFNKLLMDLGEEIEINLRLTKGLL